MRTKPCGFNEPGKRIPAMSRRRKSLLPYFGRKFGCITVRTRNRINKFWFGYGLEQTSSGTYKKIRDGEFRQQTREGLVYGSQGVLISNWENYTTLLPQEGMQIVSTACREHGSLAGWKLIILLSPHKSISNLAEEIVGRGTFMASICGFRVADAQR
ncbi:hypothetical protein TNCV_1351601 [Trichonephila clavipes]|nr:hypothetical protein TNCV_1351601 [Trichonephila clavipes]